MMRTFRDEARVARAMRSRRNASARRAFVKPAFAREHLMPVPEFVFEIRPRDGGWALAPQAEARPICFATLDAAERRARFLAIRQDVRGLPSAIHVLDETGDIIGLWRGERYFATKPIIALRHAA